MRFHYGKDAEKITEKVVDIYHLTDDNAACYAIQNDGTPEFWDFARACFDCYTGLDSPYTTIYIHSDAHNNNRGGYEAIYEGTWIAWCEGNILDAQVLSESDMDNFLISLERVI